MTNAAARFSPTRKPAGSAASSIDADALRLPVEWDAVLDVLIDDQRVWSITPSRNTASDNGIRLVPWPPPLRRYLDGAARVTVREHLSRRVLLDEECRFGTADKRVRVVDAAGRPLALDKGGHLQRCFDTGSAAMVGSLLDSVEGLLAVLREASGPVTADHLARAWNDPVQRDRALKALIADNLVEDVEDGRYALPS